jgi:hypothetical protein
VNLKLITEREGSNHQQQYQQQQYQQQTTNSFSSHLNPAQINNTTGQLVVGNTGQTTFGQNQNGNDPTNQINAGAASGSQVAYADNQENYNEEDDEESKKN